MEIKNSLEHFGTEMLKNDTELRTDHSFIHKECLPDVTAAIPLESRPRTNNYQYSVDGLTFWPSGRTIKKLNPGVYSAHTSQQGLYFMIESLVIDDLIQFEDGLPKQILDEIDIFWGKADTFKKWGFLHKRGYLLYGAPGFGKSCLVNQVMNGIQKRGGIVLLCNNHPSTIQTGLTKIREIEPDTKIVCVYEDIDATIKNYGEQEILALLDGESQINNVLNLATTNYPERLEKRIVNRPRRFDRVIRVGKIDERMRRAYFTQKLKIDGSDVEKYVKASDGFSFAAMAELVISTKCLDNDFNEMVEKLSSLKEFKPSSDEDEDREKLGFGK